MPQAEALRPILEISRSAARHAGMLIAGLAVALQATARSPNINWSHQHYSPLALLLQRTLARYLSCLCGAVAVARVDVARYTGRSQQGPMKGNAPTHEST